jgi:hypothetical protein
VSGRGGESRARLGVHAAKLRRVMMHDSVAGREGNKRNKMK